MTFRVSNVPDFSLKAGEWGRGYRVGHTGWYEARVVGLVFQKHPRGSTVEYLFSGRHTFFNFLNSSTHPSRPIISPNYSMVILVTWWAIMEVGPSLASIKGLWLPQSSSSAIFSIQVITALFLFLLSFETFKETLTSLFHHSSWLFTMGRFQVSSTNSKFSSSSG